MLVCSNYAKIYANTFYKSLIAAPLSVNEINCLGSLILEMKYKPYNFFNSVYYHTQPIDQIG